MARFFRNRTANEWRAVLTAFGFHYKHNNGDDEVWAHKNSSMIILVPSRNEDILLPTSLDMARKLCIAKDMKKKEILRWWKKNGYGE